MRIPLNCSKNEFYKQIYSNAVSNDESMEYVIPDVNPDIKNVLYVQSQLIVTSKKAYQDEIKITADVEVNIFYENEGTEGITCVGKIMPVEIVESVEGSNDATSISAVCSIKSVNATMLNSRKLLLKSETCFDITCRNPETIEICNDVMDKRCDIEILKSNLNICPVVEIIEKNFNISDEYKLPTDKSADANLMSATTELCTTEVKPVAGKLVYKATAETHAVFMSSDNAEIFTCDFVTPFSQIIELSTDSANAVPCVISTLMGSEFVPLTSRDDGSFSARFEVSMQLICASEMQLNYIEDAYSNEYKTELSSEKYSMEKDNTSEEIHISVECETEEENIIFINLSSGEVRIKDDTMIANVTLCGVAKCEDGAYKSVKLTAKGEYKVGIEDGQNTWISNICYGNPSISGSGNVNVDVKVICCIYETKSIDTITEIMCIEEEKINKSEYPSLTVLCSDKDMNMWQIAKKYHSTTNLIENANSENEEFSADMRPLLIPKG